MFAQDFQIVDVPVGLAGEVMERDAETLLRQALQDAQAESERLRTTVAPPGWPGLLADRVQIRLERLRALPEGVLLSFGWAAEGGLSLVPFLEGDVVLTPMGDARTHVVVRACYEPLWGISGGEFGAGLLHRMAESVVRAFLSRLCVDLCDA